MKKNKIKNSFLEQLRKVPIIQVACEKVGISRNSVYRWRNEDEEFHQLLDEALSEGEALVNDMSESQLLSLIREKNWQAISFWLRTRNPKFREKIDIHTNSQSLKEDLTQKQSKLAERAFTAIKMPNEISPIPIFNEQDNEEIS